MYLWSTKCLEKMASGGWRRGHSILTTRRAVLRCPHDAVLVVLVVPAEQFHCWSVWPCLSHLLAEVADSFLNHIFTLFFSPTPKLQPGVCTLISFCPFAAGAVASRHRYWNLVFWLLNWEVAIHSFPFVILFPHMSFIRKKSCGWSKSRKKW